VLVLSGAGSVSRFTRSQPSWVKELQVRKKRSLSPGIMFGSGLLVRGVEETLCAEKWLAT
jgi:hypothetical protein